MNSPEEGKRESSGKSGRSYLFLSMILLVWNAFAAGVSLFRIGPHSGPPVPPDARAAKTGPAVESTFADDVSPRSGPMSAKQNYLIGKRIDINKALKEEINSLPGISDAMADAIITERTRAGKFRSPQDLLRVKGIKEKRLKKILPFLENMENN